MNPLPNREFYASLGARFAALNGCEMIADHGDIPAEFNRLTRTVGIIDLSFRGRLCVLGADRSKFLHGQLTNDINRLEPGQGCYSAMTDNKGRIQADLNVHALGEEILLDFEPGLTDALRQRLDHFIVADDVELCDVSDPFGLISVQGPRAVAALDRLELGIAPPPDSHAVVNVDHPTLGQLYLANNPRLGGIGFDLYAATESIPALFDKLLAAAREESGGAAGWTAFEAARIAAGIPRFGQDMTEANLAPEAGIEDRAISYTKGCYIGQEILNRLHNFAQLSRRLRALRFDGNRLPEPGDTLTADGAKAGIVTSAVDLPDGEGRVGLGYVRKEFDEPDRVLEGQDFTAQPRAI